LFGEDSKELGNEHVVTVVVDFMTAARNVNSLLGGPSWFEKVGCWFKKNEREWLGDWTVTWSISVPENGETGAGTAFESSSLRMANFLAALLIRILSSITSICKSEW
jgi:hypothetical protein